MEEVKDFRCCSELDLADNLGVLSGIGCGFDSLGDRTHSLFPPALAENILGHADIRA